MYDGCCPECGAKLCELEDATPVRVEIKCHRCKETVEPTVEREVWHRTYRCGDCGRTQHVERPLDEKTYCIVCGTPKLVIVSEKKAGSETETETVHVER